MKYLIFLIFALYLWQLEAQNLRIAKIKYQGGGDWYANKTALPNLISFCNKNLNTSIQAEDDIVEVGSTELYLYPYVYLTGHGNVLFSDEDALNLRKYLLAGGFLHIDDNYGLDPFIQLEMKKVFPDKELVEIPFDHPIYHTVYDFENGLPKIHEHDGLPAQGFGILHKGRIICFYSYESDLGNGWEDQNIYNDPEEIRLKALEMGSNLIAYSFGITK